MWKITELNTHSKCICLLRIRISEQETVPGKSVRLVAPVQREIITFLFRAMPTLLIWLTAVQYRMIHIRYIRNFTVPQVRTLVYAYKNITEVINQGLSYFYYPD